MFPVSDNRASRHVPVTTWLIVALNVVVFLFELQLSRRGLDRFMLTWGMIPQNVLTAVSHPFAPGASHVFLTLLTSQFIHGGWLHIIGNMLFLLVFGPAVEDRLGSLVFGGFYLLCGVIAAAVQIFALSPFLGGQFEPNIGASGAIAGILGAYIVLYPLRWITVIVPIFIIPLPVTLPAFVLIGWWFIQQLFYGTITLSPMAANSGGVAFWAHIGGFVAGMLMLLPVALMRQRYIDIPNSR